MRFGLFTPLVVPLTSPDYLAALGGAADRHGVDQLWIPEHVVMFDKYESRYNLSESGEVELPRDMGPMDTIAALGFLASVTNRVRLGTGVLLLAQRNPVYAAKELATIDWLSNGRLDIGVGVGWAREEYEALGVPWNGRGERLDECLAVLTTLWTTDPASHTGTIFEVPEVRLHPKPVQRPHPPIFVGGDSSAAFRRIARQAAGWFAINLTPVELEARLHDLQIAFKGSGRAFESLRVVVCTYSRPLTAADVTDYAALGVEQVCVPYMGNDVEHVESDIAGMIPLITAAHDSQSAVNPQSIDSSD